jgi:hypothetical protein
MHGADDRTILAADRSRHGVMIAFDDGKTALFPAAFLYASLHHAQEVRDMGPEELVEEE